MVGLDLVVWFGRFVSRFGLISMVWYGLVWIGLVWSGLVWFGMVWYGLVWFGKVPRCHHILFSNFTFEKKGKKWLK